MTAAAIVAAIEKIIHARTRLKGQDKHSTEARDLFRYDQIVGLLRRAGPPEPEPQELLLGAAAVAEIEGYKARVANLETDNAALRTALHKGGTT